jgi:hypothetical protein
MNLAVFNAPHALAKDVTLNGYHLKKGMIIFPQVSTIMQDPKVSFRVEIKKFFSHPN